MRTASQIASAVQRATMASDDVHVNEAATDVSCRWKQHAATSHAVHLLVMMIAAKKAVIWLPETGRDRQVGNAMPTVSPLCLCVGSHQPV